jgi:hypothetical protein
MRRSWEGERDVGSGASSPSRRMSHSAHDWSGGLRDVGDAGGRRQEEKGAGWGGGELDHLI